METPEDYPLSDQELTELFREKCPDAWFPVDDSNRNTTIACLKILMDDEKTSK